MARALAVAALAAWIAAGHAAPAVAQQAPEDSLLGNLKVVQEDGRRVVEVTLQDILRIALARSNALKIAKIREDFAESSLRSAQARNDPSVTSAFGLSRTVAPSVAGSSPFLTLSSSSVISASTSVTRKTPTGITYGLTFRERQIGSETLTINNAGDSPGGSGSSPSYSSTALTGTLSIPLYQDYGRELEEVPVRQGEIGVKRSAFERRLDELVVLSTVAFIYWDLVDSLERINVQGEAVRLSERLLMDNQERLKAGVLSPADVAVSETQLARDKQALFQAQLEALRIEDQVRAALNLENMDVGYRPVDTPTLRETNFGFEALAEKMFLDDPRIGILNTALESNRYVLLQARNKEKTDLDVDMFYVFHGYDSGALSGITGFTETDLGDYGATLTWKLPLFDRLTQEEVRRALLDRSQLELQVADLKSELTVQLQGVLRSLRLAQREVETARVAEQLAKQLLDNEIERFRLGRSTSFQVAQFQQDAALARREEIAARIRYEKTYLDMLVLTGDIYQFYELGPKP